jgi:uncharacterized protein (DUF2141 family)
MRSFSTDTRPVRPCRSVIAPRRRRSPTCVATRATRRIAQHPRAEIGGLRNAKGVVRCLLFQSEDGFPFDGTKASQRVVAQIVDGAAVRGSMGPPAFDKAAFQHVAGAQVLHLSVVY